MTDMNKSNEIQTQCKGDNKLFSFFKKKLIKYSYASLGVRGDNRVSSICVRCGGGGFLRPQRSKKKTLQTNPGKVV